MTKLSSTLLSVALLATMFTGCGDKQPDSIKDKKVFDCIQDGQEAPKWTCNSRSVESGYITDSGSAPISKIGAGFTDREALANARANLAQQIANLVENQVESFTRSIGVTSKDATKKISSKVSTQLAKVSLKGSKQINYWQHPTNKTIYILVAMDESKMNEEIKTKIKSSYKDDDALWQQSQSKDIQDKLDKQFPSD